jgi:hypothetical protein
MDGLRCLRSRSPRIRPGFVHRSGRTAAPALLADGTRNTVAAKSATRNRQGRTKAAAVWALVL